MKDTWRRSFALTPRNCAKFLLVALLVLLPLARLTSVSATTTPSIASDQADYVPGATVTLTGSGWQSGEAVQVIVVASDGSWNRDDAVTADTSGNFSDSFNLPTYYIASYSVTATGTANDSATTSFTDSNLTFHGLPGTVVSYTFYTASTNCTGANTTGTVTIGSSGKVNLPGGFGSTESVLITGAIAPSGSTFSGWTYGTNNTDSGSTFTAGTCVFTNGGTGNFTDLYAHYGTTTTTTTTTVPVTTTTTTVPVTTTTTTTVAVTTTTVANPPVTTTTTTTTTAPTTTTTTTTPANCATSGPKFGTAVLSNGGNTATIPQTDANGFLNNAYTVTNIGTDSNTASAGQNTPFNNVFNKAVNGAKATIKIVATDDAGCQSSFDPLFTSTIRSNGAPVSDSYDGILQSENTVTITNNAPGIGSMQLSVNGHAFAVGGLKANESRTVNIGAALHGDNNTVSVTSTGKPGGSALLLVGPGQ